VTRLSVLCLTNAPPARLSVVLEQFRSVADEIVLGADLRVGGSQQREYAALADLVVPIDFTYAEQHLASLAARSTGEWLLRMDDDEMLSPALLERIPWLIGQPIEQYWVPRRWLYESIAGWLSEPPWWPDYHNRLVRRNPRLHFSGVLHTGPEPAYPARYLDWPIYHFECLLKDRAERERKALDAERLRPGLEAPGGGPLNEVYYVPEVHARHDPSAVPADDLAVLAQLAGAAEHQSVITLLEHYPRFRPGERRALYCRVHNTSSAVWRPEGEVRLSYRWLEGREEGDRSPLPSTVAPGDTAIVPLVVTAPEQIGSHWLEVDVVHEHVRWFGNALPVEIAVQPPISPPSEPPRRSPDSRRRHGRSGGWRRGT